MNDIETALKAACVKLALKGCPTSEHCYHAGHLPCEKPCWECWQDYTLLDPEGYIQAHMHSTPEDFVPKPHRIFKYEPTDLNNILDAAEKQFKAEWKLRLHAAVASELRKKELCYPTEAVIRRCNKAVLKTMPALEDEMDKLYREYAEECKWEDELDTDETAVGDTEDPFGD